MRIDYLPKLNEINKALEKLYGVHPIKKQANFRMSYAGDQYEKRNGTFNVYIGDIFLREELGIREVKKYPYIDDDTFIMERLIGNCHQDVMEGDYIYECFYSFKQVDHIPPLKAAIFVMNMLLIVGGTAPKTQKEAENRDKEKLALEKVKTRAYLDEKLDYTDISLRLKHGAAVTDFNSKVKVEEVKK
jgi:hypothetical protein